MKDYAKYSFWLENSGDDLTPRPALDGSIQADVAILGAGFTGLWTAYHLLQREPSLKVVVVEKEIAGFGASGRNGGWCFAGFPYPPEKLTARYGRDAAKAVSLAMYDTVDDVGRVCELEGIDAHYAKGGELEIARADYDLPIWRSCTRSIAPSVSRTTISCSMRHRRKSACAWLVRLAPSGTRKARPSNPLGWRAVWLVRSSVMAGRSTSRPR